MLCLYKPYNFNRIAAGGFSAPVRILLTVLSAWLNTLSAHSHVCQQAVISNSPRPGCLTHRVGHDYGCGGWRMRGVYIINFAGKVRSTAEALLQKVFESERYSCHNVLMIRAGVVSFADGKTRWMNATLSSRGSCLRHTYRVATFLFRSTSRGQSSSDA